MREVGGGAGQHVGQGVSVGGVREGVGQALAREGTGIVVMPKLRLIRAVQASAANVRFRVQPMANGCIFLVVQTAEVVVDEGTGPVCREYEGDDVHDVLTGGKLLV
jgi:hypothetical protein